MLLEKLCFMKTNINFRDQVRNRPPAKSWVKDFILPISIMLQIFTEDSVIFKVN